mmetsp:Transcript_5498/g.4681  ORF Transcript_5498/g.4681 Transcript_5498/m.4681 type:complete len:88 (-) Transcript_5498:110-373(-)
MELIKADSTEVGSTKQFFWRFVLEHLRIYYNGLAQKKFDRKKKDAVVFMESGSNRGKANTIHLETSMTYGDSLKEVNKMRNLFEGAQ